MAARCRSPVKDHQSRAKGHSTAFPSIGVLNNLQRPRLKRQVASKGTEGLRNIQEGNGTKEDENNVIRDVCEHSTDASTDKGGIDISLGPATHTAPSPLPCVKACTSPSGPLSVKRNRRKRDKQDPAGSEREGSAPWQSQEKDTTPLLDVTQKRNISEDQVPGMKGVECEDDVQESEDHPTSAPPIANKGVQEQVAFKSGQDVYNYFKDLAQEAEHMLPQEEDKKGRKRNKKEPTLLEALHQSWQGKSYYERLRMEFSDPAMEDPEAAATAERPYVCPPGSDPTEPGDKTEGNTEPMHVGSQQEDPEGRQNKSTLHATCKRRRVVDKGPLHTLKNSAVGSGVSSPSRTDCHPGGRNQGKGSRGPLTMQRGASGAGASRPGHSSRASQHPSGGVSVGLSSVPEPSPPQAATCLEGSSLTPGTHLVREALVPTVARSDKGSNSSTKLQYLLDAKCDELAMLQRQLRDVQETTTRMRQELSAAQKKLSAQDKEISQLKDRAASSTRSIQRLEGEKSSCQDQVEALTTDLKVARQKLQVMSKQRDGWRTRCQDLHTKMTKLLQGLGDLGNEMAVD